MKVVIPEEIINEVSHSILAFGKTIQFTNDPSDSDVMEFASAQYLCLALVTCIRQMRDMGVFKSKKDFNSFLEGLSDQRNYKPAQNSEF